MTEKRETSGNVLECIAWLSQQTGGIYEVKEVKEKRSLNANSYFYALVGKIASKMHLTKDEVHRQMLLDYGVWDKNEDGSAKWVIFPKNKPLPDDGYYWDTKTEVNIKGQNSGEEVGRVYVVVRGSHTYNSKEMYDLLQGTIQEAQQLGIETKTPDELVKMLPEEQEDYINAMRAST